MARRSCGHIRRRICLFASATLFNRPHPFLSGPFRGLRTRALWACREGLGKKTTRTRTHTHAWTYTNKDTHARFISSGNLAPMVEKQPSSCYHRNRSNGSLLFVWVPSPLPPSPVMTRPPHSSAWHSRRATKNLKQPYSRSVSHLFYKSGKWRVSLCRAEAAPVSGGKRMMLINGQRIHLGAVFFAGGRVRLFDFSNEMKLPHTGGFLQAWRAIWEPLMRFCCRSNWLQTHFCN